MRKLILLSLLCWITQVTYAQPNLDKGYKLTVNLIDAPFTSLSLRDYRELHNFFIKGKHIGAFKWQFIIPDSIVEKSEFMEFIVPDKDTLLNGYRSIRLVRDIKGVRNIIANIGVQDKENSIEAKYSKRNLFENENLTSLIGKSDTLITGNLIVEDFELSLSPGSSSDIVIRSIDPYFSWFDKSNMTYEQQLESYVDLAKKYPYSRYLITYLSLNLTRFKTREDVKKVYRYLSTQHKQSKWAKRIDYYLSNNSKNISLPNLKSGKIEPITQDTSKYNLLIFSASWCGPCIKEMPLLKKLHDDLKIRVNFTTISMDNEKNVKAFQNVLSENKIDWRTLYAYNDLDRVTDLYSVRGIPLTILVYPDGRMDRLDIRDKAIQKKLYSLK
jgi:thiol-disulfide isomerase/thioredoxin